MKDWKIFLNGKFSDFSPFAENLYANVKKDRNFQKLKYLITHGLKYLKNQDQDLYLTVVTFDFANSTYLPDESSILNFFRAKAATKTLSILPLNCHIVITMTLHN